MRTEKNKAWLLLASLASWGLAGCTALPGGAGATRADGKVMQSREQCVLAYPESPGSLYQRQDCLASVARSREAGLNAVQKTIVDECANELLALADRADRAVISMAAYRSGRDQLRARCSSSLARAGSR